MQTVLCCLLLVAAQPAPTPDSLIEDLTEDLTALATVQPLPEPVDTRHLSFREYLRLKETVRLDAPALQAAMDRFASRIHDAYRTSAIQWTFAFTLTNSLAGKPVPRPHARRLAISLIGALDNALLCETRHTDLHACLEFRDPVNNVFLSLLDLGLTRPEATALARDLVAAAYQLVRKPVFRPLS